MSVVITFTHDPTLFAHYSLQYIQRALFSSTQRLGHSSKGLSYRQKLNKMHSSELIIGVLLFFLFFSLTSLLLGVLMGVKILVDV